MIPGDNRPWIGVDLDGTLAEFHGWSDEIGKPINTMMSRVFKWLHEGKTVKIVTARAANQKEVEKIHAWLSEQGFPLLEVTDRKDYMMTELWDDRAIQVLTNTGIAVRIVPA